MSPLRRVYIYRCGWRIYAAEFFRSVEPCGLLRGTGIPEFMSAYMFEERSSGMT